MKLTDHESGIIFDINVDVIGSVFDRGPYREVRTVSAQPFTNGEKYKVKEKVPEILAAADAERRRP